MTIQAFLNHIVTAITVPGPASERNGRTTDQGGSPPRGPGAIAAVLPGLARRQRIWRAVLVACGEHVVMDLADRVI